MNIVDVESKRQTLQKRLDSEKDQYSRNKLGQYATPSPLALSMLEFSKQFFLENQKIQFLDPAFGTGSFYSALLNKYPHNRISDAKGYEIDLHHGKLAKEIWQGSQLRLKIADFTNEPPPSSDSDRANLIICNPPYVRHHHISRDDKIRLGKIVKKITGEKISGLSGLYCYFLLLSHDWLANGGVAGWLIPSEFMDVNYGKIIKQYLLENVTLIRIHRFESEDLQFNDALVSSAIVWLIKKKSTSNYSIEFTCGGTLNEPKIVERINRNDLKKLAKWTKFPFISPKIHSSTNILLKDLFVIKRGLATGSNNHFIMTPERANELEIPKEFLTPILPSPRYVPDIITADKGGYPGNVKQLVLFNCKKTIDEIKENYPSVYAYIQFMIKEGINNRYLSKSRTPWYKQEERSPAPIVCTYMGRNDGIHVPFRFILNQSNAIATNVYLLMYPKPLLQKEIANNPELLFSLWQAMNKIPIEILIHEGRTYGGGLHKVEPKELAQVPVDFIISSLPQIKNKKPYFSS